jgi:hypothetical protein
MSTERSSSLPKVMQLEIELTFEPRKNGSGMVPQDRDNRALRHPELFLSQPV